MTDRAAILMEGSRGRYPRSVAHFARRVRTQANRLLGPVVTDVEGNSDNRTNVLAHLHMHC
jgi:hypothetical protein